MQIPLERQQRALLGTVGGKLYCTCANVAHQNSLCSACQGPVVSFSVECKPLRVLDVQSSPIMYSNSNWPKAGCNNLGTHLNETVDGS